MKKLIALALVVPLLLAGCSSSPSARGPGMGGDPFADQSPVGNSTGAGVPDGVVDCAAISQQNLLDFSYGVQALSQLNDQAAVDAINDGSVPFDTDGFTDSLVQLHALDGYAESPYGDPIAALKYYEDVNAAASNLLAYGTPVPEGEFTAYTKLTGGSAQVLSEQAAIGASYNANCAG
ncbi:hypothetical protein [Demequina aurantiaca]|uniref:hypothetical protein n=1 Tax=Demequina aurantiaca TaxID=676200 RepID=UPI003D359A5C